MRPEPGNAHQTGRRGDEMPRRVELLRRRRVFDDFFRVDKLRLRFERYDGSMSPAIDRLVFLRHDAVAAVLWNRDRERLVLVEQFRPATYDRGPGWMLELPAGLLDTDEPADVTMKREIREETGYAVAEVEELFTFYPSPGASTERLTLYYAEAGNGDRADAGGGADPGEDLRVVEWSLDEIRAGLRDGRLADGKTVIAAQWLFGRDLGRTEGPA